VDRLEAGVAGAAEELAALEVGAGDGRAVVVRAGVDQVAQNRDEAREVVGGGELGAPELAGADGVEAARDLGPVEPEGEGFEGDAEVEAHGSQALVGRTDLVDDRRGLVVVGVEVDRVLEADRRVVQARIGVDGLEFAVGGLDERVGAFGVRVHARAPRITGERRVWRAPARSFGACGGAQVVAGKM